MPARSVKISRSKWVDCKKVGNEIMLLNKDTSDYYSLNKTGAAVWQLCETERTVGEVLDDMRDLYDLTNDQIEEVSTYIDSLITEKLLAAGA